MNTDAAKAPTPRLENAPSSSSTSRGKTNKIRGAAKAPTHSGDTQAPPKSKRRDKSQDSGVISRPTSDKQQREKQIGVQASCCRTSRTGSSLTDSTGKIATRLIWTDTRKPRTSLRKIRYAQQVTWKFANPVWSSTSRFIPRESTCGVLWSQLSKACQNCISFGNALMERDDELKKTKDKLSEAKERIKELTAQVNAEESDD